MIGLTRKKNDGRMEKLVSETWGVKKEWADLNLKGIEKWTWEVKKGKTFNLEWIETPTWEVIKE
jgi:hypothetical protein